MKTIALTGGGTAGHIMPNIALVDELAKYYDRIVYIGGDGIEKKIAEKYNLQFFRTDTVKLSRKNITQNFKIPFVLLKGINQAKEILDSIKPSIIFSKGGYVSLPTCYAAKSRDIPIVVHESDFSLGLANKLVSRFAEATITSFKETKGGEYIGNPIRKCITQGKKSVVQNRYKLKKKSNILVMGGSMGSEVLNKIIIDALPKLLQDYNVIHIAGKGYNSNIKFENYFQLEFAEDIENYFAASDLIISRAGANSLSEITANGIRNIVVPLPKGGSRGDQEENARSYQNRGLVDVLHQVDLTPQSLINAIEQAFLKPKPKAINNEKIVSLIVKRIIDIDKAGKLSRK